ncbi:MAG: TetR/AcrR family transcriptional regulator, partial [Actinomycetes bacterium]
MTAGWLLDDPVSLARERILDAAGQCFAEHGVTGTSMAQVAAAAGCSRQTVYRYYADRDALRAAFVDREARRVGAQVAAEVAGVRD